MASKSKSKRVRKIATYKSKGGDYIGYKSDGSKVRGSSRAEVESLKRGGSSSRSSSKTVELPDGRVLRGDEAQAYGNTPTASSGSSRTGIKPSVVALNKAREEAVNAGKSPYAGSLATLAAFEASLNPQAPIVASTSPDRAGFRENSRKLDEKMAADAAVTGGPDPISSRAVRSVANRDGSMTHYMDDGTTKSVDRKGNVIEPIDGDVAELAIYDEQEEAAEKAYSSLKKLNDQTYRNSINDIRNTYSDLRSLAEESNSRYMAQVNQAGYATGAFRYTPQLTAGTIWAVEQAGIQKLMEIDQEENLEIAKAKQARDTNNYNALQAHVEKLEAIGDKRVAVIQEQHKTAKEMRDALQEQMEQSSRDEAIAGIVAQGITNPANILDLLNYNEEGEKIGDFTLEEVATALGHLKAPDLGGASAFKFDEKTTAALLGNNISMNDILAIQNDLSTGAHIDTILDPATSGLTQEQVTAVKEALGIKPGTGPIKPGVGAADSTQEALIRTRLFNKLQTVLNKGPLSDDDAKRINTAIITFRDAGMTEQEILDKLGGFTTSNPTPYNSQFRDLIVINTKTADEQSTLMSKVSTLLENGNYEGAMKAVENAAMKNAQLLDKSNYVGQATAENWLYKIDNIRSILAASGFVGPIEGSFQKVLGRFKSSEAVKLQGEVASLVAQLRNDIAGSAVTASEAAFLDPLIASITDPKSSFAEKINTLENRIMGNYNATRESVNLPRVTKQQALRPNERLQLYSSDNSSGIIGGGGRTSGLGI